MWGVVARKHQTDYEMFVLDRITWDKNDYIIYCEFFTPALADGLWQQSEFTQSAGAVEYTDSFSAEG